MIQNLENEIKELENNLLTDVNNDQLTLKEDQVSGFLHERATGALVGHGLPQLRIWTPQHLFLFHLESVSRAKQLIRLRRADGALTADPGIMKEHGRVLGPLWSSSANRCRSANSGCWSFSGRTDRLLRLDRWFLARVQVQMVYLQIFTNILRTGGRGFRTSTGIAPSSCR